jgi:EmrB/QacA subfamily drug resistance transporter
LSTPNTDQGLDKGLMAIAWVVVLGSIMAILDTTVVNVAINHLTQDFDAPLSTIQWVITGYMLALATVIPLTGWAAHRFGTKRLYIVSIGLFAIGSALCGAAWSAESLIAFRVLQGLGGGMIMPAGMTILTQAAGPQRVGRVMAVVGIPMMLGPIMGPILGGWLVDDVSWRWIFYINLPIAAVALPLAFRILPKDEPQHGEALDVLGLALLSPGLAALLYGLAKTGEKGFSHTGAWLPTVVGLLLVAGFVLHALRHHNPLLDVRLFKNRAVGAAGLTMTLFMLAFFGAMLLLPLYLQTVRGETALQTGLMLAPQGFGAMLMMPVAGRLTDQIGPGKLVLTGLPIVVVSMAFLTQIGADTSYWALGAALFVMGIGMGLTMMPTISAAIQQLKRVEVPRASTSLNIIQQVGGAIGTAILSVLLTNAITDRIPQAEGGTAGVAAIPPDARAQIAPSLADAFGSVFVWAVVFLALAAIPALFLPRSKPVPVEDDDEAEAGAAPVLMHA